MAHRGLLPDTLSQAEGSSTGARHRCQVPDAGDGVTGIAAGRITANYTGTTTCEGPITDGKLTVMR
jgi:hypothetical protein